MGTEYKKKLWFALLEAAGPRVPKKYWPKRDDHRFEKMSQGLKQAVDSAVMSVTKDTSMTSWKWDSYDRRFYFDISTWLKYQDMPIHIVTKLSFDPSLRWLDEIERVMIEAEEYVRKIRTKLGCKDD